MTLCRDACINPDVTEAPDIITPVIPPAPAAVDVPRGRPADRVAIGLAAAAFALALAAVIWFVWGYLAEDGWSNTAFAATILALAVGSLGLAPPLIIGVLARRAWREGGQFRHYVICALLAWPWVIVAALVLLHAPLPIWTGLSMFVLYALLAVWACVSAALVRRNGTAQPDVLSSETMQ